MYIADTRMKEWSLQGSAEAKLAKMEEAGGSKGDIAQYEDRCSRAQCKNMQFNLQFFSVYCNYLDMKVEYMMYTLSIQKYY